MSGELPNVCCNECVLGSDAVSELGLLALIEDCPGSELVDEVKTPTGNIEGVVVSCPKFLGFENLVFGEIVNNPPLVAIVDNTHMEIGDKWLARRVN